MLGGSHKKKSKCKALHGTGEIVQDAHLWSDAILFLLRPVAFAFVCNCKIVAIAQNVGFKILYVHKFKESLIICPHLLLELVISTSRYCCAFQKLSFNVKIESLLSPARSLLVCSLVLVK